MTIRVADKKSTLSEANSALEIPESVSAGELLVAETNGHNPTLTDQLLSLRPCSYITVFAKQIGK